MNKRYLTILSFATLLCVMLLGVVSCKKDDTPSSNKADFFIDVSFLPESETNGEVGPRLVVNFNDEAAMIELRGPSDSNTAMETVLLLCPDHEAMVLCGNDSLMVCAAYDMETYTPSHDVLIVTPMGDNALLLTKGFMDWNTNTLTTHDMMVLPIEDNSKNRGDRGSIEGEIKSFFFNRLVKRVDDNLDQCANFSGIISPFGIVFSYIGATITTNLTAILYSDDPEELYDATEYSVTNWTGSVVQDGILNLLPEKYSDVASRIFALLDWHQSGGHGKVNDYVGGTGEEHKLPYETLYLQAYDMVAVSTSGTPTPMYIVNLSKGNITENTAYLKGCYRFVNDHITPMEMGYIIKVDGGPEHIEHDMNFHGITLSGLQKATKYTAFAYVKGGFGDRVLSPGVTFWTLGFEAFPNSLIFPAEGDTKIVGLSYSDEDITSWNITSKPSWCTITKDDDKTFSVKVGKSTKIRSGTITVTGHSKALGTLTQNVSVTQGGTIGWDGTAWLFSGTITYNGILGSGTIPVENSTLVVNSVSNNDVENDLAQMLFSSSTVYNESYTLEENGNLIYTATTGVNSYTTCNWQVTFVRTSPTTATADMHMDETAQGQLILTYSGILQGTLTNAK